MNFQFDLHHAKKIPLYDELPEDKLNLDQRLARKTRGVVKLANFISLAGTVLTIAGVNKLSEHKYKQGIALTAAGRGFDGLDGKVAGAFGDVDEFGEKWDVINDRVALLYAALKLSGKEIPHNVTALFAIQQLAIGSLTAIAKLREREIRPSAAGKFNAFLNWAALGLHATSSSLERNRHSGARITRIGAYCLTGASLVTSTVAVSGYYQDALGDGNEERTTSIEN